MSILQEFEEARKQQTKEERAIIESFLVKYPEYYLSDIYYNPAVAKQMWQEAGNIEKVNNINKAIEILNSDVVPF